MMKIHNTEALMSAEISRRSLMKTSALGKSRAGKQCFTLPFSQMVRAAQAPVEEKAVWSSCTVNCGSRCLLRLHVKDDTCTGWSLIRQVTTFTVIIRFGHVYAGALSADG
ncbi:MAG: hypothetical protein ACLRP3_07610 [Escherichia sp.]